MTVSQTLLSSVGGKQSVMEIRVSFFRCVFSYEIVLQLDGRKIQYHLVQYLPSSLLKLF
jgi:hypothetical protein